MLVTIWTQGWDRMTTCKGAYGSRYQSIYDLIPPTQPMNTCEDRNTGNYVRYSFRTVILVWGDAGDKANGLTSPPNDRNAAMNQICTEMSDLCPLLTPQLVIKWFSDRITITWFDRIWKHLLLYTFQWQQQQLRRVVLPKFISFSAQFQFRSLVDGRRLTTKLGKSQTCWVRVKWISD